MFWVFVIITTIVIFMLVGVIALAIDSEIPLKGKIKGFLEEDDWGKS